MILRVQHKDGTIELLNLSGEWIVVDGTHMNRIRGPQGFEHFFTFEGYYDGWGGAIQPTDPSTADAIIEAIESKRQFVE